MDQGKLGRDEDWLITLLCSFETTAPVVILDTAIPTVTEMADSKRAR